MDPETFLFRKCLYQISNHLTPAEVEKLKFMLDDDLPRSQLETARTGFDLFCLMEEKQFLSLNDLSFLREILDTVGKDHYVDHYYLDARASAETHLKPVPGYAEVGGRDDDSRVSRHKKLLGQIGDAMSKDNVRDMALFFHGGTSSIHVKDLELLNTAEKIFTKLVSSFTIQPGDYSILYNVLDVLGRQDLCTMITDYYKKQGTQLPFMGAGAHQDKLKSPICATEQRDVRYPHQPSSDSLASESSSYAQPTLSSSSLESSDGLKRGRIDRGAIVFTTGHAGYPSKVLSSPTITEQDTAVTHEQQALAMKEAQFQGAQSQIDQDLRHQLKGMIQEVNQLKETKERLSSREPRPPAYEMKNSPHGIALVIVNEKFDPNLLDPDLELSKRDGARQDSQLLSETFLALDYAVETKPNLTADGMLRRMDEIANSDHSRYDSFVCCVSTHGNAEGFYSSDSVLVKYEEFENLIKRVPSLQGKPKMFFYQTCRRAPKVKPDGPDNQYPPHEDADIFIAYAATPNNYAYISSQYGSWLAAAMNNYFTNPQYMYTYSLRSLMNFVSDQVNSQVGEVTMQDGTVEYVRQCVQKVDTLSKEVFFFPEEK